MDGPTVLLGRERDIPGGDIGDELLGERGIELARLVVDRHLLLVLRGGDLYQVQVFAHWATCAVSVV
jgi:hypothetical protein